MVTQKVISLDITLGSYDEFVSAIIAKAETGTSEYVCVANVHMLVEAYKNKAFAARVNEAFIVTPDGKPLTWALKLLFGIKQDRVAGMDLLPDLLTIAQENKIKVYFYGGTDKMLSVTRCFLEKSYPNLVIGGMYSPPFRTLTAEEEIDTIQAINSSNAGIVFVVLGCPKQENWMSGMHTKINGVMVGIGGALPVLVGMQKRAPKWMQHMGLEWFFRLIQEPKRLFKRYLITNSTFIYLLVREKIASTKRREG